MQFSIESNAAKVLRPVQVKTTELKYIVSGHPMSPASHLQNVAQII